MREHSNKKVPVIFVLGKHESSENSVAIRRLGSQDNESMKMKNAIAVVKDEAQPPV